MSYWREFSKGIIKSNPLFVLMLGLCPTLAVSTSIKNGLAMGLAASTVLICSNFIISLIRNFIPKGVRIPCYIIVISSFVTIVELLMRAFFPPEVAATLGIFVPLIVVNCIILGRAEAFAGRNGVIPSVCDGLGMGLGFTLALLLVAAIREVLGAGTIWGMKWSTSYEPAAIMILAPGAFLVLGLLLGFFNYLGSIRSQKSKGAN